MEAKPRQYPVQQSSSQLSTQPNSNSSSASNISLPAPALYRLGARSVPSSQVFIARKHVFAMVNPRGLLPGHVLVCPARVVAHFSELTELETLELFVCSQQITKAFEEKLKFKSFTIIIQDGPWASQSLGGASNVMQ